jgi:hypothetical protein
MGMKDPIVVCGREFRPEVLEHLNRLAQQQPPPSGNALARETCALLAWYSPDGRPSLSSARVALHKLQKRGLLKARARRSKPSQRLRASGQPLSPLTKVPRRVDQIKGLELRLLSGHEDPLHGVWNDLIIAQHPCGDAPLVGTQLRYLIGSEHGWLGALGIGSAAFALASRDQWIGWSTSARLGHLRQVVGLSRVLIREEVHCTNLASKVLSLTLARLPGDWQQRYGLRPLLVETFVDRAHFTGRSLAAANWLRVGASTGRGRLGPQEALKSLKDVWLFPLDPQARTKLQEEVPPPLAPLALDQSLAQEDWCAHELAGLALGDVRLDRRAVQVLEARWNQPQASFYGSFPSWTPAKGAYGLIEHESPDISLQSLLRPHTEATQARMAAEPLVLLPQDTTGLNYTGLKKTTGLGPLGEEKGRGLWLHTLLAFRPDGIPLGLLAAQCWARPPVEVAPARGRNAKSIDEKESGRWLEAFECAAAAARRMPQTKLVVLADREGDLYELHDAAQIGPANLHVLVRAQHDRNLKEHQKLWGFMADQPVGETRVLKLPRCRGQAARTATVQVRWASATIMAPAVGCKKGWPALTFQALWIHEPNPPAGAEPIDWMLLTDLPVTTAAQAWEKVQWYCRRWGIEEWHRALKNGCGVEQREFKTAEHLRRVLAFDLIVAWRVLACVKLGRVLPQLLATVLYSLEELEALLATQKKTPGPQRQRGSPCRKPTASSPAWEAMQAEKETRNQGSRVSAWACADSGTSPGAGDLIATL